MKGVYWRPKQISRAVLVFIAVLAVGAVGATEVFKVDVKQRNYREKIRAARHMDAAMKELKRHRLEDLKLPIDEENDFTRSGLLGHPLSVVTSNTGYLESKQTTINPNFAAVAAHLLKRAGVEKGDVVAVGFSGSFPALNLAVHSACEALEIEPIIICSAAGSEWGANIPGFTWLQMEKFLYDKRIIRFKSVAASIGGVGDVGYGMPPEGVALLKKVITEDLGLIFIDAETEDPLERRMEVYEQAADGRPIKAYLNVGGGTVSVGTSYGKKLFRPGLNRRLPPGAADIDSVMVRYASQDIPVIHFTKIKDLATKYNLPIPPTSPQKVGQGNMFTKVEYNMYLTAGLLLMLMVGLWLLLRMNLAQRITSKPSKKMEGPPEPMV